MQQGTRQRKRSKHNHCWRTTYLESPTSKVSWCSGLLASRACALHVSIITRKSLSEQLHTRLLRRRCCFILVVGVSVLVACPMAARARIGRTAAAFPARPCFRSCHSARCETNAAIIRPAAPAPTVINMHGKQMQIFGKLPRRIAKKLLFNATL